MNKELIIENLKGQIETLIKEKIAENNIDGNAKNLAAEIIKILEKEIQNETM